MIKELKDDAAERMEKTVEALVTAFSRIRTGRANPAILDGIEVDYYGTLTPIRQLANIHVEDGRTLTIQPWERKLVPAIEKAILKSDLGVTPNAAGETIRVPMPPLTEQTRRELIKAARAEAEQARVAVRNIRRDVINDIRELLREKEISEDDERRALDEVQAITDRFVARVDKVLEGKEADLLEI